MRRHTLKDKIRNKYIRKGHGGVDLKTKLNKVVHMQKLHQLEKYKLETLKKLETN